MGLPFTEDQFLNNFADYNSDIFPAQVFLYLLAGLSIYLVFNKKAYSDRLISCILFFLWSWMGIVYYILFFSSINKPAYIFGFLFIVQAALFLKYGVLDRKLSFSFSKNIYGLAGLAMILYGLIIYPIFGYFIGHVYPYQPTFGAPCPTTIFTFGLLLWIPARVPKKLLAIPLLWSFVGFSAAFAFGILEDILLLVAGLVAVILIWYRDSKGDTV
ncbi:DUF6064 family protein [Methanolobus chelungpuianus]|uniref:Uncharacterized protein n=1 Tax=Methanolobus chelungpuianus TaxID=502115 RepID=A0AAE3H6U8_9EURY|nr:DUF6064 family protein [Methanolobus chelungpuianus]MCQ6961682.1 hypothetical protein [Methanolobus chelungpuianus]